MHCMHCITNHAFALCIGILLNATHCIVTLEMWNQICQLASIDIEGVIDTLVPHCIQAHFVLYCIYGYSDTMAYGALAFP